LPGYLTNMAHLSTAHKSRTVSRIGNRQVLRRKVVTILLASHSSAIVIMSITAGLILPRVRRRKTETYL